MVVDYIPTIIHRGWILAHSSPFGPFHLILRKADPGGLGHAPRKHHINRLKPTLIGSSREGWVPWDAWMWFRCGVWIFKPHLNTFVGFGCDESKSSFIECAGKYTMFGFEWSRDCGCWVDLLELMSGFPIVKAHGSVITTGKHDTVTVHAQRVDNSILMGSKIVHELTIGAFPFFYVIGAACCKCELFRMQCQCSNSLFMMRQHRN